MGWSGSYEGGGGTVTPGGGGGAREGVRASGGVAAGGRVGVPAPRIFGVMKMILKGGHKGYFIVIYSVSIGKISNFSGGS